ncbi:MAG TPA: hypothetical protein VD840_15450 [Sinorhizobium sp.]|nr:hypothetical protein [Sinorhizobium sp.]
MSADRSVIIGWLSDLAAELVTDALDRRDVDRRLDAAAGADAESFASEALALMRVVAESVDAPAGFDRIAAPAVADQETGDAVAILLALGLAVAGVKVDWPSRPSARAARSRIALSGDAGLSAASRMGGEGADLYAWLSSVVSASVRVVSEIAANAVPVVRVQTKISLPSTALAYQLYGDANRAQGLVEIAGSATPLLMPSAFDALAS